MIQIIKFMSKQDYFNPIECKKEDFLSPYSYQILTFMMTFVHLRNSEK